MYKANIINVRVLGIRMSFSHIFDFLDETISLFEHDCIAKESADVRDTMENDESDGQA